MLNVAMQLRPGCRQLEAGVPNYFGEQRFGRNGSNLDAAEAMFGGKRIKDRDKRSIFLSAARSYLFNEVISARIQAGLASQLLAGDCLMLAGSHSFFSEAEITPELQQRLASGDLQLTAPLWGRGRETAQGAALEFEQQALAAFDNWRQGLEAAGLQQERRPLLLIPRHWRWDWTSDGLVLNFWLPAGCYATSLLRELLIMDTMESNEDTGQ